jgi:hypothetical protein
MISIKPCISDYAKVLLITKYKVALTILSQIKKMQMFAHNNCVLHVSFGYTLLRSATSVLQTAGGKRKIRADAICRPSKISSACPTAGNLRQYHRSPSVFCGVLVQAHSMQFKLFAVSVSTYVDYFCGRAGQMVRSYFCNYYYHTYLRVSA